MTPLPKTLKELEAMAPAIAAQMDSVNAVLRNVPDLVNALVAFVESHEPPCDCELCTNAIEAIEGHIKAARGTP